MPEENVESSVNVKMFVSVFTRKRCFMSASLHSRSGLAKLLVPLGCCEPNTNAVTLEEGPSVEDAYIGLAYR